MQIDILRERLMLATMERTRLFWQPGCTNCMRIKELFAKHGVDFESIML